MDDDVVEAMTDKILGGLPNTYAFTKALSEGLVEEAMPHIPAIILRYKSLWNCIKRRSAFNYRKLFRIADQV